MVLSLPVIARIAIGVQTQSVGAVGPAVVEGLSLSYASLGTLVSGYSMLGLVLVLPAGWLMGRFGERRIVLIGLGFMGSPSCLSLWTAAASCSVQPYLVARC